MPGARLVGAGRAARARAASSPARSTARASSRTICSATRGRSRGRSRARPRGPARRSARAARSRRSRYGGRRGETGGRRAASRAASRAGGERIRARAVVIAAGAWSAPLAAGAGVLLPLEPRKGQLVRLRAPAPDLVRHKVVDASYLRAVASPAPGLEVSTVVETTFEGDVLVGSSRERRGFDTGRRPRRRRGDGRSAPRGCSRACADLDADRRVGRPAPVAARQPARDRPVAGGAGHLARDRPRGRRRRARPGHRAPDRAALHGRASRSSTLRRSTPTASTSARRS